MKKIDLSIIVPIYNEEESIIELYQQIIHAIQNKLTYELIFINDGSTDKTHELINAFIKSTEKLNKKKIVYINYKKNSPQRGQGG